MITRKKYERLKTSGNHSSNFHDFAKGRLDTYYMHFWLNICDSSILEAIIGSLPDDVVFESTGAAAKKDEESSSLSSLKTPKPRSGKRSAAEVLIARLKEQDSRRDTDVLKLQKARSVQLDSYRTNMNALLKIKKKKKSLDLDEDERNTLLRMEKTISGEIAGIEKYVIDGTVWAEECTKQQRTPVTSNRTPPNRDLTESVSLNSNSFLSDDE